MSTSSIREPSSHTSQSTGVDGDAATELPPGADGEAGERETPQARTSTQATKGRDGNVQQPDVSHASHVVGQHGVQPSLAEQSLSPSKADDDDEQQEEESVAYEEPPPEELFPPQDFKPYFTLIEDPETGEYHHPNIHYLFADDDAELFTNAALDAIDMGHAANNGEDVEHGERIMILDMTHDGKQVASATSLSPHWQALQTSIAQAPSWGTDATPADRGLMLKISGTEARNVWASRGKLGVSGEPEDLARAFSTKLQSLDEIMGYDEKESMPQEPGRNRGVDGEGRNQQARQACR